MNNNWVVVAILKSNGQTKRRFIGPSTEQEADKNIRLLTGFATEVFKVALEDPKTFKINDWRAL